MATIGQWFYKTIENGVLSDRKPWTNADDLLAIPGIAAWDLDFVNQFIHRLNLRIAMERILGEPSNAVLFYEPLPIGSIRVTSTQFDSYTEFLNAIPRILGTLGSTLDSPDRAWAGVWTKGIFVPGSKFSLGDFVSIGTWPWNWTYTRPFVQYLTGVYNRSQAFGGGVVWPKEVFCHLRKVLDATATMALNVPYSLYWTAPADDEIYADGTSGYLCVQDNSFDPDAVHSVNLSFPITYAQTDNPDWDIYPIPVGGGIIKFNALSSAYARCAVLKITNPTVHLCAPGIPIRFTATPLIYGFDRYDEGYYPAAESPTEYEFTNPNLSTAYSLGKSDRPSVALAPSIGTDVLDLDAGDAANRAMHGVVVATIDDEGSTIPESY